MANWRIRVTGSVMAVTLLWYASWMLTNLNPTARWLSLLFVLANAIGMASWLLALVNHWRRAIPPERRVPRGAESMVLVLIPTYGEPTGMVERTARSVLEQDWPEDRLVLVVSDDGHRPVTAAMVAMVQRDYPRAHVISHEPPRHGDPARRGEAKAGNLNAAYAMATARFGGDLPFVETRDADDEVGDPSFLRQCIGQIQADDRVAFVQTVKEARVSPGDPFNNMETMFYRGLMLGRNAANAVFPCGSGLVWRRAALDDIGGFPTWNLVEDLQSGVEALKRGWRGVYLPIVGAVAQHAPEDLPNVYKQRGTWAVDTARLIIWGRLRGLTMRQQLHFLDLGLFYFHSLAPMLLTAILVFSMLSHTPPLRADGWSYALHFWPFFLATTLFQLTLTAEQSWRTLLRWHQMWVGLAPVYIKAIVIAVVYGPRRKPTYRVTRKVRRVGWYWRECLVQTSLLAAVVVALGYSVTHLGQLADFDRGSATWVLLYGLVLAGFVRKSWFGTNPRRRLSELIRCRRPHTRSGRTLGQSGGDDPLDRAA